jgi:diacylglycerol kinase (ATP)
VCATDIGIGVDAAVALAFHRMRSANPSLFSHHRLLNKLVYMYLGAKFTLKTGLAQTTLASRLRVTVDGQPLSLPSNLAGLVILNLPSFAGGLEMWQHVPDAGGGGGGGGFGRQSFNDGKVEVIGLTVSAWWLMTCIPVHTALKVHSSHSA